MEPGSRVELPPRGADLSFLSNDPNQDTPSKWLTFNSTPNGNTTPGTAFGSPFWSSLAGATAQASTSAGGPRTGNAGGSASGGHGEGQGRQHSPSREFNPFELSFFPEHNEHLLNKASGKEGTVKGEKEGASDAKNHLSSSVSSLKRPFSDAEPQQVGSDELASSSTSVKKQRLVEEASQGASDLGVDFNAVLASTSGGVNSGASNSEGSAYAPSPSLNLNTSPDSGSPASSMIPTPNLQSALLPPNTNLFGNGMPIAVNRKDSTPPDIAEAAKLNMNGANAASQVQIVQAPLQQQQQQQMQYQPQQQQQQGYPYTNQQQPQQQNFLPPINVNYGYPPYMPQQQAQQSQPPPQQVQRMVSPAQSGPARRQSGDSYTQQSPVMNSNAIPYANGRGPASAPSGGNLRSNSNTDNGSGASGNTSGRPSRASARNGGGRNSTSAVASAVKIEELDGNEFISGNGNGRSYSPAVSDSATNTSNKGGNSRKGGNKKQQQQQQQQAQQAPTSGSSHVTFNANAQGQSSSGANGADGAGNGDEGEGDEDEDDEHKRKAFLERNRQAACRSRQKKKEWINNLETHAARLQSENQHLSTEIESMRKEMFALRHTLQFHERCGCAANPAGQPLSTTTTATAAAAAPAQPNGSQQQIQQPTAQQPAPPIQQQQQPALVQQPSNTKPIWQRPLPPSQQSSGVQAQSPARAQTPAQQGQAQAQAQVIPLAQSQHFPPQMASMQRPSAHVQTQPQPLSGGSNQRLGNGATMGKGATTLAPSPLQGMLPFQQQQQGLHPHMQPLPSKAQQAAPPNINLSASSLEPNAHTRNHHLPSHGLGGNNGGLGTSSDITRPGSAGARFGLATPNFSDLFNGAMGKFGNSGTTPGFGSGLLFTPGGIMSSGNTASHFSSYNTTNAGLPNTFGLSLQDIPIRPASAPPTPSPAVDSHSLAIPQDYFSSKKPSAMLSTPSGFADFLASWPVAQNSGSVLA